MKIVKLLDTVLVMNYPRGTESTQSPSAVAAVIKLLFNIERINHKG